MEKLYVGIDPRSNNNYISIIDEQNRVIRHSRIKNSMSAVLEKLDTFKSRIQGVVIESTFNWYWLVDGLKENGYKTHLANPSANSQYSGLKNISDKNDAKWLATLLRLKILKEGYIMPKNSRALRDLCRKRMQLVNMRTSNLLSIQNLFARNLGWIPAKEAVKQREEIFDDANLSRAVKANQAVIETLNHEIRDIEKIILRQIDIKPEFQGLKTIKGVGNILVVCLKLYDDSRCFVCKPNQVKPKF